MQYTKHSTQIVANQILCSFKQIIKKFWELCLPKQISPKKQKKILRKNTGRISEAAIRRCSVKTVSLKVTQNSEEKSCLGVSFLKGFRPEGCNFIE